MCVHGIDFYGYPWGKGGCFLDVEDQDHSKGLGCSVQDFHFCRGYRVRKIVPFYCTSS